MKPNHQFLMKSAKCLLLLVCFACLSPGKNGRSRIPKVDMPGGDSQAKTPSRARSAGNYGKIPLSFEANQGQTAQSVKFLSHGPGYTLLLTGDEVALELQESGVRSQGSGAGNKRPSAMSMLQRTQDNGRRTTDSGRRSVLRLKLLNANHNAVVTGASELPGKANYFIGNDPHKWRTNVPTYARVKYEGVYPGVDLVFYGNQQQVEHDFVVSPGADASAIAFRLEGSKKVSLDAEGNLVIAVEGGQVLFQKPLIYQGGGGVRREIPGGYVLKGAREVAFKVGAYDPTRPLVIDPVLAYSTYLGGSGNDYGVGIAVDSSGNAYVTGGTTSINFPTTAGTFQTSLLAACSDCTNAFVVKLNPAGSALVYSTYLGGSQGDQANGIAVDSSGNAYVTGYTQSSNFPTTAGAFQTSPAGTESAFVTKLNPSGSALVYSTYLGGSSTDIDVGERIAVDSSGDAYLTGTIGSGSFPTTAGAFQTSLAGTRNAFVTKLNPSGSALAYSTYLGGSGVDDGYGIAADSSGNAYVTGYTVSTDFPTTAGAFQTSLADGYDAFVTKLNPTGSALVYSTYLGGSGGASGQGIAVDFSGDPYVTGYTYSTNFPTTAGVFQPTFGGGLYNAFITKLNSSGSALVYSTYLGGNNADECDGIAVDSSGNAYVTGFTYSTNFPTTVGAFQTSLAGEDDAFYATLNSSGSALIYSTYLGGSSYDSGNGLAVDSQGNAYVAGGTESSDFPRTAGAFQPSLAGVENAFVAKISASYVPGVNLSSPSLSFQSQVMGTTSPFQSVTLTNSGPAPLTINGTAIMGDFAFVTTGTSCPYPGGSVASQASCTLDVTFTPAATGLLTGLVTVTDNNNGVAGSTQTIDLSGTGTGPVVSLPAPPTFPSELVGATSPAQTVTVTNTGNANLTFTAIGTTGPFAIATSGTTCSTSSPVAAAGSCTVALTFTPTTGGTASGTLSLTDNAGSSPQTLALSATGQDFSLAVPSGSSSSATISPGGTATYTITATAIGGFNQAVSLTCTGAPLEANCGLSQTSVTPTSSGTNVTVTVTTTASSVSTPRSRYLPLTRPLTPWPGSMAMLALLLAGAAWAVRNWGQHGDCRLRIAFLGLGLGMLLTLGLAACGGGGGTTNKGTPPGKYTITVTGSIGSGSSALSRNVTLTLNVS